MDAEGGSRRRLTSDPPTEAVPSWSRDGRWLNFASRRGSGWDVHKVAVAGGPSSLVTRDGGFASFESIDGKFLYYAKGRPRPGSGGFRRRAAKKLRS
jgi:Tol biopolymer transport system component